MNLSDVNVPELIADMWEPLNEEQREFLANHFTLQVQKNEVVRKKVRYGNTLCVS